MRERVTPPPRPTSAFGGRRTGTAKLLILGWFDLKLRVADSCAAYPFNTIAFMQLKGTQRIAGTLLVVTVLALGWSTSAACALLCASRPCPLQTSRNRNAAPTHCPDYPDSAAARHHRPGQQCPSYVLRSAVFVRSCAVTASIDLQKRLATETPAFPSIGAGAVLIEVTEDLRSPPGRTSGRLLCCYHSVLRI